MGVAGRSGSADPSAEPTANEALDSDGTASGDSGVHAERSQDGTRSWVECFPRIGPSSAYAAGRRVITEMIVTGRIGGYSAMLGGMCWMVAAWFAALSPPYGSAGNFTNRFVAEDAWLLAALPLLSIAVGSFVLIHRENSATSVRLGGALLVIGAVMATVSLGWKRCHWWWCNDRCSRSVQSWC